MSSILTHHYELTLNVHSRKRGGGPIARCKNLSILELFKNIKKWNYETQNRVFGNKKFCGVIPIINIKEQQNRIDLLLTLSDTDADTPVTRDFIKNKTTAINKEPNHGVDKTAHIVLKLDSTKPYQANFSIEYKTGVSAKLFIDTLNYFIKDAINNTTNGSDKFFVGIHPTQCNSNGDPEPLNFGLKFTYASHLSEQIINAFDTGEVNSIEFYTELNKYNQVDSTDTFASKKTKMYLQTKGKLIRTNSTSIGDKLKDIQNSFKALIGKNPQLKDTKFTIKLTDVQKNSHTVHYLAQYEELSWSKKVYIDESLRQPE